MSYLLNDNYDRAERLVTWVFRGLWVTFGIVVALVLLWGYRQVQIEQVQRQSVGQIIQVLNYNLEAGTLKLPPVAPVAAAPPSAPTPPPTTPPPPPAAAK